MVIKIYNINRYTKQQIAKLDATTAYHLNQAAKYLIQKEKMLVEPGSTDEIELKLYEKEIKNSIVKDFFHRVKNYAYYYIH